MCSPIYAGVYAPEYDIVDDDAERRSDTFDDDIAKCMIDFNRINMFEMHPDKENMDYCIIKSGKKQLLHFCQDENTICGRIEIQLAKAVRFKGMGIGCNREGDCFLKPTADKKKKHK